jgi:hypothetical protein
LFATGVDVTPTGAAEGAGTLLAQPDHPANPIRTDPKSQGRQDMCRFPL